MLELIAEAQTVARAIRRQFIAIDPTRPLDDRRLYRLANSVFWLKHVVLPAVEQGTLRTRPHEAMVAVESILSKALPKEVVVLAEGAEGHAYREVDVWSEIRTQLSDLGVDDRFGEQCMFLKLEFPTGERDNVLLHANLCHEIGHEMVGYYRWADDILAVLPGDTAIQALAAQIVEQSAFQSESGAKQKTVLEELVARRGEGYEDSGVLTNWLGELLSDAVALCVLGPAAAFATAELVNLKLGRIDDSFERSHPRRALRMELQRLHLERWPSEAGTAASFFDLLVEYPKAYEYLEEVHQSFLGRPGEIEESGTETYLEYGLDRSAAFYEALERALRNKLPDILAIVRKELGDRGLLYTPAAFADEVPQLVEKVEALLPPSTLGTFGTERPASYAGIMNAGALSRFDHLDRITQHVGRYRLAEQEETGAGSFQAEELVFRLVRKAIADADIHRRWVAAEARR